MANGRKYWLSPHRGLPAPTGRLAEDLEFPEMGAFEETWPEEEGLERLPPPLYLQSRAESMDQIQQSARVQRFLQQANARTRLAYGPGAGGGLPPVESYDSGTSAGGYAPLPGTGLGSPLIARRRGAEQLYGSQPLASQGGYADDDAAVGGDGGFGGGLQPSIRRPFDAPLPQDPSDGAYGFEPAEDESYLPPARDARFEAYQSGRGVKTWGGASFAPGGAPSSEPYSQQASLGGVAGAPGAGLPRGLRVPVALPRLGSGDEYLGRRAGENLGVNVDDDNNAGYYAMQARREWVAEQSASRLGTPEL